MEAIFLQILNMSINASWIVLAVILLRFLLKKAPKALVCVMWALVAIRLMIPFSIESVWSLVPSAQTIPQEILQAEIPRIESGMVSVNQVVNPILSESLAPATGESIRPIQVITSVAGIVWIVGMACMLLYMVISYLRIYVRVKESLWQTENIFICDRIDTPFIFGVFRPRIYLPSTIEETDKAYVIAHEKAHLSRRDHWWKPLGFFLLTVYWFNPILWIAYILLCKDIELACDEKVIKRMGAENKRPYADALINCSAPGKMITACPLAFGENGVKGRIKSVLHYKKPAFWIVLIALVACIVMAVCFLTNPAGVKLTLLDDGHGTAQYNKMFITTGTITLVKEEQAYPVEEIASVKAELEKIKVRPTPVSQSRAEDRDQTYKVILNDGAEKGRFVLCFNDDFSEYWINDGVKSSQTYKVQNPSVVKGIFDKYLQEEDLGETSVSTPTPAPNTIGKTEATTIDWLNVYLQSMASGTCLQFALPEYPGVDFYISQYFVTPNAESQTEDGIYGIIENVFLTDLTGDNRPDICATLSGSGVDGGWVQVYDYATNKTYSLTEMPDYYWLTAYENQLYVLNYNKWVPEKAPVVGKLNFLTESGSEKLVMVDIDEEHVGKQEEIIKQANNKVVPAYGVVYFYGEDYDSINGWRLIEQCHFFSKQEQQQLSALLEGLKWTFNGNIDREIPTYNGVICVNGKQYFFAYDSSRIEGELYVWPDDHFCKDVDQILDFIENIQRRDSNA